MSASSRPGANNLPKARFFLDRFREEERRDQWDLLALASHLEAALVFAKGFQDSLADEAGCGSGGPKKRWLKRVGLWQDPVCEFLLSERDLAVHHDGTVSVVEGRAAYLWVMPARAYASGGRAIFTTSPANPTTAQQVRLRRQMKLAKEGSCCR